MNFKQSLISVLSMIACVYQMKFMNGSLTMTTNTLESVRFSIDKMYHEHNRVYRAYATSGSIKMCDCFALYKHVDQCSQTVRRGRFADVPRVLAKCFLLLHIFCQNRENAAITGRGDKSNDLFLDISTI